VKDGRGLVFDTFSLGRKGPEQEVAFRRALHDGVVANPPLPRIGITVASDRLNPPPATQPTTAPSSGDFEVRFQVDPKVYDGRFANNGWLQETPDPLTKLTWDNAALGSYADAKKLGVDTGDMLGVTVNGKQLHLPAYILPGQPLGVIGISLGYGRRAAGNIGNRIGFNAYQIKPNGAMSAVAQVQRLSGDHQLVMTQEHHIIDEVGFEYRETRVGFKHKSGIVIRETTLAEYAKNPRAAHPHGHGNLKLQLFEPPDRNESAGGDAHAPISFAEPHAWGMAVDMTACIGCNACMVACQAENNVPIVGKAQVAVSREMHWIRIDRYFKGAKDDPNPEVAFQPMMCVHCENAPCEQVCPVAATVHDTEGLNTMVYNRCIGTRYCSNNCPYKVRRFNYFDFHSKAQQDLHSRFPLPYPGMPDSQQKYEVDPIHAMVFNPDVTVRMRGVMEKCTYCTQRITGVKIKAKNDFLAGKRDSELVNDGEVLTACQQSCPTQAITFGNINDKKAAVTQLHRNPRAYSVLEELNTRPRTQYLAKLRNPSELVEAAPVPHETTPGSAQPAEQHGKESHS
jgi:molybdopterin-containing oxidoreductase family iron-sulfur binding subunit